MNNGFLLKFIRIWWAGFKVICRLAAFNMVLAILFLPLVGLTALVGDDDGGILSIVLAVLIVVIAPIIFYLTSKYLDLLGDNDRDVADGEKSAPRDGPRSKRRMRHKIVISTVVAFCISSWLSPPDAVTALVLGSGSAFLCGAALLILARSNFMKSLSPSMQAVVCILVCILSVLAVHASALYRTAGRINRPSDFASVSSSGSLSFGDLWIAHLSDRRGFWSRETECVICSADPPKTWGYGRATCRLTFSDDDRVEVKPKKNETVWIDKQHRVTFLGPVLGKEDVSLLRSHGHDEKLKILSPDDLLALVKKLRAEQAASTAPLKAAS